MKKFEKIQAFESVKLTKEQMNHTTGGMRGNYSTLNTRGVNHVDGVDDRPVDYL